MNALIQWTATALTIAAASMIAAHINQKTTGVAFIVFTVSSLLWVVFASMENDYGLLVTNVALTVINLTGVYRYLIRKKPA